MPQVIEHSLQSPHPSKNGRLLQRCHHNDASYQITLEYVFTNHVHITLYTSWIVDIMDCSLVSINILIEHTLNNLKEVHKEIT